MREGFPSHRRPIGPGIAPSLVIPPRTLSALVNIGADALLRPATITATASPPTVAPFLEASPVQAPTQSLPPPRRTLHRTRTPAPHPHRTDARRPLPLPVHLDLRRPPRHPKVPRSVRRWRWCYLHGGIGEMVAPHGDQQR